MDNFTEAKKDVALLERDELEDRRVHERGTGRRKQQCSQ